MYLWNQGDRFGGALDAAAKQFSKAFDSGMLPMEFVNKMKKDGKLIMGIGHRVKSVSSTKLLTEPNLISMWQCPHFYSPINTLIQDLETREKADFVVFQINNPDMRVQILKDFVKHHFPSTQLLDYALEVEKITTSKVPQQEGNTTSKAWALLKSSFLFKLTERKPFVTIVVR